MTSGTPTLCKISVRSEKALFLPRTAYKATRLLFLFWRSRTAKLSAPILTINTSNNVVSGVPKTKFHILTPIFPKNRSKAINMEDFTNKHPLFKSYDFGIGKSTHMSPNMWKVSTPEVNLPSILRMSNGNNDVNGHFQCKTPIS